MNKVRNVLKNSELTRKEFESILGKEYTQALVLGKEDFGHG